MLKNGNSYREIFSLRDGDTVPVFYGKKKELYRISLENLNSFLINRIENLENNVYKITYFEVIDISAGTSGTISIAPGATILKESFETGGILSTLNTEGYPEGQTPTDGAGSAITANLDSLGNWNANDVYPDPVALIYQFEIKAVDFSNVITSNIIDLYLDEGDKSYTFEQATPSTTWIINHNLGKFPSITVEDSSGNVVYGAETYSDKNNLTIEFSSAFSGKAHLN
jgi:hypothetical protein